MECRRVTQAAYRAAAITFLTDYAADAEVKMQIYPGRPLSVMPPTGFVDEIRETFLSFTESTFQGQPEVDVIVLFGLFDSKEAVDQKDAFVDGLLEWVYANPHEAGANTLCSVNSTQDLPAYVNDWVPPDKQRTFYGCRITLGGFRTN